MKRPGFNFEAPGFLGSRTWLDELLSLRVIYIYNYYYTSTTQFGWLLDGLEAKGGAKASAPEWESGGQRGRKKHGALFGGRGERVLYMWLFARILLREKREKRDGKTRDREERERERGERDERDEKEMREMREMRETVRQ